MISCTRKYTSYFKASDVEQDEGKLEKQIDIG